MSNFLLLGVCLLCGILLRHTQRLPKDASNTLNGFVFYISLPALVISQFHQITFSKEVLLPVSSAWLLIGMSALFFFLYGKKRKLDRQTIGALVLTAGLGNTSFVGFPLVEAFYGRGGIKTAMIVDQLGTFPAVSTFGIIFASYFSMGRVSWRKMVSRIFAFPPTYALLIAFATRPFQFPDIILTVLVRLGDTLTPLALVSVGLRLNLELKVIRKHSPNLFSGLFFKLFLAPFLFTLLYVGLFQVRGEATQITILETAMAPMITSAIVASEYELNTELANLMVGLGIPLSFITVTLWAFVLKTF